MKKTLSKNLVDIVILAMLPILYVLIPLLIVYGDSEGTLLTLVLSIVYLAFFVYAIIRLALLKKRRLRDVSYILYCPYFVYQCISILMWNPVRHINGIIDGMPPILDFIFGLIGFACIILTLCRIILWLGKRYEIRRIPTAPEPGIPLTDEENPANNAPTPDE